MSGTDVRYAATSASVAAARTACWQWSTRSPRYREAQINAFALRFVLPAPCIAFDFAVRLA
eukprot:230941-Rhodomonas_salina.1